MRAPAKVKVDDRYGQGERTRQAILKTAVDIASVEGLEGLSFGGRPRPWR